MKTKYNYLILEIKINITKVMEETYDKSYYYAGCGDFVRFSYDKDWLFFNFIGYVSYNNLDNNKWETTKEIIFGIPFNKLINNHSIIKNIKYGNDDYNFYY